MKQKFKKNMNSVTLEEREKINRDGFKKFQNRKQEIHIIKPIPYCLQQDL